jgi:hypothetical protein
MPATAMHASWTEEIGDDLPFRREIAELAAD